MMKTIFWLTFCILNQAWAFKNTPVQIDNSFWSAALSPLALQFEIKPLDNRLQDDCRDYEKEASTITSADEFNWRRRLPLAGDMKDRYQAVLALNLSPRETPQGLIKVLGEVLRADLSLVRFSGDPKVFSDLTHTDSLLKISEKWKLAGTSPQLHRAADGWRMSLFERDLACDLLAGRARIEAAADLRLSLAAEDILKLNRLYSLLEDETNTILSGDQASPPEQAAQLGLMYGNICQRFMEEPLVPNCIAQLFSILFESQSLQRSAVWQNMGDTSVIVFPKSEESPEAKVILSVHKNINPDSEESAVEDRLKGLKNIPYNMMSESQRREHQSLVQIRAVHIKKKIFEKYKGYLE